MCIYINKIKEVNSFSDEEAVYLAYEWVLNNIELNCENNQTEEQNAVDVYSSGSGTSYGISNLFKLIGYYLNLNIDLIKGKISNIIEDRRIIRNANDFVWNYVEINGKFYLIDVSSSKGYCVDKEYRKLNSLIYFGTNPNIFIYTHFPDEDKWQLLNNTINYDEFLTKAALTNSFFYRGFKTISPDNYIIDSDEGIRIILKYNETFMKYDIKGQAMYTYEGSDSFFYVNFQKKTSPGKIELYREPLTFNLINRFFLIAQYYDEEGYLCEFTLASYKIIHGKSTNNLNNVLIKESNEG